MNKAERARNQNVGTIIEVMRSKQCYFKYNGGNFWEILEVITDGEGALPLYKVRSVAISHIQDTLTHKFFKI